MSAQAPARDVPPGEGGGVESGGGSALVRFTRPHTMRGTILGAFAGVGRALLEPGVLAGVDFLSLIPRAFLGLFALLLGNAYIVGVNQLTDVKIDRINKPFLPVASGEMGPRLATGLVVFSGIGGLALVRSNFSLLILGLYAFGMVIGTLYSVPPFRLKRYPVAAALTISCVRGFLLNFGVYHATIDALGLPFTWSPPIVFLAAFMTMFACVIAIAKDMPDIKGDTEGDVATFATRRGTTTVVRIVSAMLFFNYAMALVFPFVCALVPPTMAQPFNIPIMLTTHILLAGALYRKLRTAQPSQEAWIKRFYAFIWRLFYAEYIIFPFI